MVLCLGEPPRRFLWYWLSHLIFISFLYLLFIFDLHFVVVLHLSFSFIHILFSTSSLTLPWTIYSHFVLSAQPIAEWFATFSFSTIPLSFYRERYGFEWAFFTHRCFLPYAPCRHFWYNLLLSRLPWEPAVIPWNFQGLILILEIQTRLILSADNPFRFPWWNIISIGNYFKIFIYWLKY